MSIKVDSTAAEALLKRVGKSPERAQGEMRNVAQDFLRTLQGNTPVDTGALLASEQVTDTPEGAQLDIGGGDVDYAGAVEARTGFIEQAKQQALANIKERMRKAALGG